MSSGSGISMGSINLTWSGATDDQGISGYELRYTLGPTFTDNAWISMPFIPSAGGTGSYTHTITTFVDHKFSIRTRDTGSQYSEYRYLTVPLSPQVLISDGYSSSLGVCKQISTNPIFLVPMQVPHAYSSYVNNADNSIFIGDNKYWRIAYTDGTYYSCQINPIGQITSVTSCSVQDIVNSVAISADGFATRSDICSSGAAADTTLHYNNTLGIDSLLYSTYIGGILSNLYDGNNLYHILVNGSSSYVVKIGTGVDIGKILSLQSYSSACPVIVVGTTCIDPKTLIDMMGDVKVFAGDVKIGDFVYTIHEITGEYGEYEVIYVELSEQEKLLINFTDGSEIKVSNSHKFLMKNNEWLESYRLIIGDVIKGNKINKVVKSINSIGIGLVVKLEINDAHTYIAAGLISHNKNITTAPTQL